MPKEVNWITYEDSTLNAQTECLYRISYHDYHDSRNTSKFKVEKICARKIICKSHKNVTNRNCPKCGNNVLFLEKEWLYCKECKKNICYVGKERKYYTPFYNGVYEDNGYIYYYINQREAFQGEKLGKIQKHWYSGNKCVYINDVNEIENAKQLIRNYIIGEIEKNIDTEKKEIEKRKKNIRDMEVKLKKKKEVFSVLLA